MSKLDLKEFVRYSVLDDIVFEEGIKEDNPFFSTDDIKLQSRQDSYDHKQLIRQSDDIKNQLKADILNLAAVNKLNLARGLSEIPREKVRTLQQRASDFINKKIQDSIQAGDETSKKVLQLFFQQYGKNTLDWIRSFVAE